MMFRPPELMIMFAVPFSFSVHPEQQRLNEGLKRYVFKHEKDGGGSNPRPITQRNGAVYESHFDLFRVNQVVDRYAKSPARDLFHRAFPFGAKPLNLFPAFSCA